MGSRPLTGAVEPACNGLEENLVDQCRLPGTGDAGHNGENTEREFDVDVTQIVLASATNLDNSLRPAARLGDLDLRRPGEKLSGQ